MKQIKRFDNRHLSELFGLEPPAGAFLFKPANHTQAAYAEPHRKEMYSLGLLTSGTAELRVGLDSYRVQAPGLIAIGPDEVRQWVRHQADLLIIGLFFTEDFVVSGLADALFLQQLPFYQYPRHHFMPVTAAQVADLLPLFAQLEKKQASADQHKWESVQALLRVLLLEVRQVAASQVPPAVGSHSQAQQLTTRFKHLLAARADQHRTVRYYADQLFVSPKHLSQTLKEQTGKTARALLEEQVCLEAKVRLQVEQFTISQVAQQLSFANPSFFGKFFKRSTGMSPQHYRQLLAKPQSDF